MTYIGSLFFTCERSSPCFVGRFFLRFLFVSELYCSFLNALPLSFFIVLSVFIHLSACVSLCLSLYLYVSLFIHLYVCLSIYQFIYVCVVFFLSLRLSIDHSLYISLSVCLFVYSSTCLFIFCSPASHFLSVYPSVYISPRLSFSFLFPPLN